MKIRFLTDILHESTKLYGPRNALTMLMGFRTVNLTYQQVYTMACQVARMLEEKGIGKGDNVIICAPNSPYWIVFFWGCLLRGAVVVALNIQSPKNVIDRILEQTQARLVLKHQFFKHELPQGLDTITIEYLAELCQQYPATPYQAVPITEEDLVQIMYTSGTTGDPKGVMLTHRNMASNQDAIMDLININMTKDRMLSILPLSHIFEQSIGFLLPYAHGVQIIYAHTYAAVGQLLKEWQISKMITVPEFLQLFMARIETALHTSGKEKFFNRLLALSKKINNKTVSRLLFYPVLKRFGKLDTIACGGAYLDPALEHKWNALGVTLLQGYGLTETSPCATTNTFTEHKFGSVGKPLTGVTVRIADDAEIQIKGPNVFKGYYKAPEKTAEAFTQDGFFKTGDLGYFDEDGFLFLKGRKKYMILSAGGQNVYPEDIEREINVITGVQESCVVGIEKDGGSIIHAVVLCAPGATLDVAAAIKEANSRLASYQQINAYSVWPDLDFPRTVTRKVKKNDIIAWIVSQKKELPHGPTSSEPVVLMIAKIAGVNPATITGQTKLIDDLHLDSLMRVELVAWIEQELGSMVDEGDITATTTIEELIGLIKTKRSIGTEKVLKKWPRTWWAGVIRFFLQPFFLLIGRIFIKVKVEGLENITSLGGPIMFMPNHTSYLDPVPFCMALPAHMRRNISFAAARDVLYQEYWYLVWLVELVFNSFPIQRGNTTNIKLGLQYIGKMLDYGFNVTLFPEGAMSKSGEQMALKKGSGLVAVEMGVPVVPVELIGVNDILPYEEVVPRKRGTVTVRFGKPIYFKKSDSYEDATRVIDEHMQELLLKKQ